MSETPTLRRGFGALFEDAKSRLDSLQHSMSGLLPSMPGLPVAKYFDIAIGVDFHESVFPLSPLLPVPHIGMVFDIMGAMMSAISTVVPEPASSEGDTPSVSISNICKMLVHSMKPSVQVHGQWVANAGTSIQHLPGVFVHLPFPIIKPMASSEMWMGSSTVLMDGGPCSTQFHPALSCNLIGIPAPIRPKKVSKPKVSLMAPTSMLTIMASAGKPVLVGGPPTIDLFQLSMQLGLKGMGKLWKKTGDKFQDVIDSIKKKNPKLGAILQPVKCKLFGEPVDAATGRVYSTNTDIELSGFLPFVWERTYYSDAQVKGALGYNWHHSYHMGLYDMGNGFATLRLSDGRETAVPLVGFGEKFYNRKEQLTFSHDSQGYLLTDAQGLCYRFQGNKNREGYQMLSEVATSEGFSISLKYNLKGELIEITDSRNQVLYVENTQEGFITRIYTFANGKEIDLIQYRYDELGNLIYVKDVIGAEKHFEYQGHLLVKLTNQTGQSFHWEYQGKGDDARCVHTWGDGGVLDYKTTYLQGHTITRNSYGATTHYFYDERKLIYKIINENGGVTHQHYNAFEELEFITDPEGLTEKYFYNDFGKLISIENANGQKNQYQYDANHNLIAVTSFGNKKMFWRYDQLNRIIEKTFADGNQLQYHYEGKYLKSITDSKGNAYYFHYDERHQLIQLLYPNETFQQWQYDDLGNVLYQRDVRGNVTQYGYDNAGNVIFIKEADGNTHHFEYDTSYNLISAKDDTHNVGLSYGSLGVLQSRTQNGRTVRFSYNKELQLTGIRNEVGEQYRFELDPMGNVLAEIGFDGRKTIYERDQNARIIKRYNPASHHWTEYEYDGQGNIVKQTHNDQSWAAYKYDKDGLLIATLTPESFTKMLRDKAGRVIAEHQNEYEVTYQYNTFGELIQTGSSLGADITQQFDTLGNMSAIFASNPDKDQQWKTQIAYDDSGLEIHRQLNDTVEVTTQRDRFGRVLRHSIGAKGIEQSRKRYKWNRNRQLQQIINERNGDITEFTYDPWDNLVSATYEQHQQLLTIYKAPDAIGNLFETQNQTDRKYQSAQLQHDGKWYYHYDKEGNLVQKSPCKLHNEKNAQKWSLGVWQYTWNANGSLKSVKKPSGQTISFEYDALGRRIAKRSGNKEILYIWSGNVLLHEVLKTNDNEQVITWVYEQGSFVPTAKLIDNKSFSIISDYIGRPVLAFDEKGEKVWSAEYDIYGKLINLQGDKAFIPFRQLGQYEDVETGLYYNRFRYYDCNTGTYISQDPIGLAGNNPNIYAYVFDSNTEVDVFGLFGDEFDVGLHKDLLLNKNNPDLRSHHVGQKAIMKDLVANYDEMKAPAILVHKKGHNNKNPDLEPGIVSRSKINPKTGKPFASVRELLARDIRELRRVYPEIPNSKLQELIDLNKKMYPEMKKQPKTKHH
ncbi:DUF6531 domain-containing protein [Capnocytophaga canimorsus]|uniref:DUF6531 domain-containing protein n=1 Tax=Capnocytophaga canimorsus TaxID=28188 RepID=UPI0037D35B32